MKKRISKHSMLHFWFHNEIARANTNYIKVEDEWGHSEPDDGSWEHGKIYYFYTYRYRYHMKALDRGHNDGYLGCQVSTRKPRAGEDYNRGRDLPDGPFVYKTWEKIKNAIIRHELVEVVENGRGMSDGMELKED